MGECRLDGAYEIAEIILDGGIVERWLDEAESLPHTLIHTAVGWYLHHPQPSVEDIAHAKVEARGGRFVVTLKIRRGKEVIAEFLSRHRLVNFYDTSEKGLVMVCGCGEGWAVPWDAIGHTGGPIVKQEVKACNAKTAPSERSIQRAVDSGNSHVN